MSVRNAISPRDSSQTTKALLSLRELLMAGELVSGQRVSEVWAVDRLGVSRTPVRAALMRLEEEGLLKLLPGGGYGVKAFTVEDALDAIDMRGALEGLAARRAAERGVGSRLTRALEQLLAKMDAVIAKPALSVEDVAIYADLNQAFHSKIVEACGGQTLPSQIERITAMPFAHPSAFVTSQPKDSSARSQFHRAQHQHRCILEALVDRDGSRVEALMREHAQLASRNLKLAFGARQSADRADGVQLLRYARAL